MKFGIKLWSNHPQPLNKAVQLIEKGVFDYIELYVVPESTIEPFLNIPKDILVNIHAPHGEHGTNIGEPTLHKKTTKNIITACNWANKLNSEYIVIHCETGSVEFSIKSLQEFNYDHNESRFAIENMPLLGLNSEQMIGYSPNHIKKLLSEKTNVNTFCFDFGHAIKSAYSIGIPYKDYLSLFLQFKPKIFHVSDGLINSETDKHMGLGEGNYDMKYIANFIKLAKLQRDSTCDEIFVTLETPTYGDTIGNAVKNLNAFKKYF